MAGERGQRNHEKGDRGLQLSSRARVFIFVGIVFSLTWLMAFVSWRLGGIDNFILFPVILILAMFIPGLTAAVMIKWLSKGELRYAGLRWGNKRYIGVSYLLMLVISLATYGITIAVGWGRIDWEAATFTSLFETLGVSITLPAPVILGAVVFTALTTAVIVNSIYAFGEELGWRGFLLPSLLHLGKFRALVISGAIWGVWHTPFILMGHLYPGNPYLGVFMITVMCILLGIIFGWLRLVSNSLAPPVIAHAALNAMLLAYFPSFLVTDVNPFLGGGTGVIGLSIMGIAALSIYLTRKIS